MASSTIIFAYYKHFHLLLSSTPDAYSIIMNFTDVLNNLDHSTRVWASGLSADDLASILSAVYRVPGLINSLKAQPVSNNAFMQAADIGKKGEMEFLHICEKLSANYTVINTAKIGKQGDFILEYRTNNKLYRCLVDIKNYKSTVPKKEIDKFYEDLTYGTYDAGLMISYASRFSGIADNIHIEQKDLPHGAINVMYVSDIPPVLIIKCIEILFIKVCIVQEKQSNYSELESSVMFINTALQQSATTRRMLSELQLNISGQIQRCQENLIGLEVQVKQAIKKIDTQIISIKSVDKTSIKSVDKASIKGVNKIKQIDKLADLSPDVTIVTNAFPVLSPRENNIDELVKTDDLTNTTANRTTADEKHDDLFADLTTTLDTAATLGTATTPNTINYDAFVQKDIKLIRQLADMNIWKDDTVQVSNKARFSHEYFTIELIPLKTKTRVILTRTASTAPAETLHKFNKLKTLFVTKADRLVTELSQKIIDHLVQFVE